MADQEAKAVEIKPNLEKYVDGVSASGKKTKNCGDPIAAAVDGFTVEEIRAVASKMTDVTQKDLEAKYAHLNVGMQIMNLRNRIRGAVNALDKAHEKDNAVVPGLEALKLHCEKGRAAANKRADAATKEKAAKEAEAAKKAEEKAAKAAAKPAKKKAKKAA
jgi:hypothetical protein